jgi:hypothetical protein
MDELSPDLDFFEETLKKTDNERNPILRSAPRACISLLPVIFPAISSALPLTLSPKDGLSPDMLLPEEL